MQVVKEQLERPKFEDSLQGVLELTKSVSLTETLLAADLDVDAAELNLGGTSLQQAVTSLLPPEAL